MRRVNKTKLLHQLHLINWNAGKWGILEVYPMIQLVIDKIEIHKPWSGK